MVNNYQNSFTDRLSSKSVITKLTAEYSFKKV